MTESVSNREKTADDRICDHIIGLKTLVHGWDVIFDGEVSYPFNFCPVCGDEL